MSERLRWIAAPCFLALLALPASGQAPGSNGIGPGNNTDEDSHVMGLGDWDVEPFFTVGEDLDGYFPPGILDGIGAITLNQRVVRLFVNHELADNLGYPYQLANGTSLTGARVSYFDVDSRNRKLLGAGPAYDTIIDRAGNVVTDSFQIDPGSEGIRRLCSSGLFEAGEFGLVDDIYFTGEETGGGQEFGLDVENGVLYTLPWLGRAAWENITLVDTGDSDTIGIVVGDDRGGAPLLLYVGQKQGSDFLGRNGLSQGRLYVWVADDNSLSPEDWNGTGTSRTGTFVEIDYYRPDLMNMNGYDAQGFADQATQDALAAAAGAFQFSRPEDVATNPADGTEVVLASTGRGELFPSDNWGTTYLIDIEFNGTITAELTIIYDGDDAGAGQFAGPDFGMRSPDNLDWADDGFIYVQEDRSTVVRVPKDPAGCDAASDPQDCRDRAFGGASGMEASVWKLDPSNGELTRIAMVDRDAVLPSGQTDTDPLDLGDWETSGILDVTNLFRTIPGEKLFVGDAQSHSVRGGAITTENLVEGGQLFFLSTRENPGRGNGRGHGRN